MTAILAGAVRQWPAASPRSPSAPPSGSAPLFAAARPGENRRADRGRDLMSNGRLQVIFGAGYVPFEFAMFGASLKDRGRLLDEGIATILRALHGERFEVQWPAGLCPPAAGAKNPRTSCLPVAAWQPRRSGPPRLGVGFGPMRADIIPLYEEECRKLGREPGNYYRPCPRLPA